MSAIFSFISLNNKFRLFVVISIDLSSQATHGINDIKCVRKLTFVVVFYSYFNRAIIYNHLSNNIL